MTTSHAIQYRDSRDLACVGDSAVDLVVTSPPYPMISMWDRAFSKMNPRIRKALTAGRGMEAFDLMHLELAKTWKEVLRVLVPGGFACINVGDATRTVRGDFRLYPNKARVLTHCCQLGFETLPEVIWRKPTNSPTKFLGSGMLPCGAYVTLEHEAILVFRKPGKKQFLEEGQNANRRQSSFFWAERNKWFSDLWDLNGTRQKLNAKPIRSRSGAFPFEIPFRLINMYSAKHDVVLDPFLGTATTMLAAIVACRNSVGVEIETGFRPLHRHEIPSSEFRAAATDVTRARLLSQVDSVRKYASQHGWPPYRSLHGLPVVTRQETQIALEALTSVTRTPRSDRYVAEYESFAPDDELAAILEQLRLDSSAAK